MPGSSMSSTYVPCPRIKRGSSLRFTACPMPPTSGDVLGVMMPPPATASAERPSLTGRFPPPYLLRRILHRFDNVDIPRAPAQIAGDGPADLLFGWCSVVLQKRIAGHEHARCAEATLQTVLLPEPFLDGMQLSILLQAFHRQHIAPISLDGEERTGFDWFAIQEHRARPAVGG